jgi:hypothetical protein
MNRTTWTAVFWTVLVLCAATMSTYLPWNQMTPVVARQTATALAPRAARMRAWLDERRFVFAARYGDRLRVPAATGAMAGAAALALLAAGVGATWALRTRRRRPHVLRMAGSGESAAEIARRTGLPQDAVRLMLSPMLRTQRGAGGGRTGKFFRKSAASAAGAWRAPRGRASAT